MDEENTQPQEAATTGSLGATVDGGQKSGADQSLNINDHNSLSSLLEEFERGTNPQKPEQQQEPPEPAEPFDALSRAKVETLSQWAEHVDSRLQRAEAERLHQLNVGDFERIVADAEQKVKDLVGEGYARRWLMAESLIDPNLKHAFDQRYSSPEALAQAQRTVERSIRKLVKEASKPQIDRDVTADRAAVTFAMRGTRGTAPESPAPKLGSMTNAEYNVWLKDNGLGKAIV